MLIGKIAIAPVKPPVLVAVSVKLPELPAVTLIVDWLVLSV
jgi:hypothetical protein